MSYEITIKKSEIKEVITGKEWKPSSMEFQGKTYYDYTPEITKNEEVETLVLQQTLDELDLIAVIKAINKIK